MYKCITLYFLLTDKAKIKRDYVHKKSKNRLSRDGSLRCHDVVREMQLL